MAYVGLSLLDGESYLYVQCAGAMDAGLPVGGIRISREAGTTVRTASYLPDECAVFCRFLSSRKVRSSQSVYGWCGKTCNCRRLLLFRPTGCWQMLEQMPWSAHGSHSLLDGPASSSVRCHSFAQRHTV